MSITIEIRFTKNDKYGNHVFICSKRKPEELEALNKLNDVYEKMNAMNFKSFLPVYKTDMYSTIRIRKTEEKFMVNAVYQLVFSVHKFSREEKESFVCILNRSKLVKKAPEINLGEVMNF